MAFAGRILLKKRANVRGRSVAVYWGAFDVSSGEPLTPFLCDAQLVFALGLQCGSCDTRGRGRDTYPLDHLVARLPLRQYTCAQPWCVFRVDGNVFENVGVRFRWRVQVITGVTDFSNSLQAGKFMVGTEDILISPHPVPRN